MRALGLILMSPSQFKLANIEHLPCAEHSFSFAYTY